TCGGPAAAGEAGQPALRRPRPRLGPFTKILGLGGGALAAATAPSLWPGGSGTSGCAAWWA
ncbi:hypothetical protein ACFWDM_02215, partial [Streptomyces diastaticus]|uniref:hypothetical protein n=1 Tax=Streptomyces diastaticus TaxID=1956 RepID=UPI0036645110